MRVWSLCGGDGEFEGGCGRITILRVGEGLAPPAVYPLRHALTGVPPPPKGGGFRLSLRESSREAGERAFGRSKPFPYGSPYVNSKPDGSI